MRNRDEHLRWIEKLISGEQEADHSNALVIPTARGRLAIMFSFVEEVVAGDKVQPLAFLPGEFCGVLSRGNELAPVIDTGGEGTVDHVVLVRGKSCLLGLRFHGAPTVVDLNEIDHDYADVSRECAFDDGALPVLDVDDVIATLLEQD